MEHDCIVTLIVESEPGYAQLICDMLGSSREIVFKPILADTLAEGIRRLLTDRIDVVLLNPILTDSWGLDTFMRIQEVAPDVPVVIFSSIGDASVALSSMKWGAEDYIYQGEVTPKLLWRSLSFAVERNQNRERMRQSEEKLRAQYMGIPVPTFTYRHVDGQFVFVDYNRAARKMTDDGIASFLGRPLGEIIEDGPNIHDDVARCFEEKTTISREILHQSMNTHDTRYFSISCVFVPPDLVIVHVEDITARKAAQNALMESELKYRTLIETIPHGIEEINPEGIITYSNAAYDAMYGYLPGQSIGKSIFDLAIDDEMRTRHRKILSSLILSEPDPSPYMVRTRTCDNQVRDIQIDWNYKRDQQGKVIGFVSVITDITEHKQMEEALKASERLYRIVVENAHVGISVVQGGRIRFINQKNCEMLGYDREEIMLRPVLDFVHPDDLPIAEDHYQKILDGILISPYIFFRVFDKSGAVRKVLLNTVRIVWNDNAAILSFMVDITKQSENDASLHVVS